MKNLFKIALQLTIIALFTYSCNDKKGIVNPQTKLAEGSYSKLEAYCDSIFVTINIYGSNTGYNGTSTYEKDIDGIWALSESFRNTNNENSFINNDTLKFRYYYKESQCYNCTYKADVNILFNHDSLLIDFFALDINTFSQYEPSHYLKSAYSSSVKTIVLKKIPYTIDKNGNIIIEILGSQILQYKLYIQSGHSSYRSDFDGSTSTSESNNSWVKSINKINESCRFYFKIYKK